MANKSLRVLKSFIKYKTVHLGTVYSIWWKITQNLQSCMSQAYIFSSVSHLGEIYTCINKDRALQMSIKGLDTKYSIIMYLYNLHNPLKKLLLILCRNIDFTKPNILTYIYSFIGKLQGV